MLARDVNHEERGTAKEKNLKVGKRDEEWDIGQCKYISGLSRPVNILYRLHTLITQLCLDKLLKLAPRLDFTLRLSLQTSTYLQPVPSPDFKILLTYR